MSQPKSIPSVSVLPTQPTQAREVAQVLVQDIINGTIPDEGSRISGLELSRRYGVGRGPLREAILRLEGMGLVVRVPHVGARYDFHYRIIKASGNQRLIRALCDERYNLVRIYRKSSYRKYSFREPSGRAAPPEQALVEHQMIYTALKDRDGELAEILMRRHITRARRKIETVLE